MTCFICEKQVTLDQAAEIYSLESCMCAECKTEYIMWCEVNGAGTDRMKLS